MVKNLRRNYAWNRLGSNSRLLGSPQGAEETMHLRMTLKIQRNRFNGPFFVWRNRCSVPHRKRLYHTWGKGKPRIVIRHTQIRAQSQIKRSAQNKHCYAGLHLWIPPYRRWKQAQAQLGSSVLFKLEPKCSPVFGLSSSKYSIPSKQVLRQA